MTGGLLPARTNPLAGLARRGAGSTAATTGSAAPPGACSICMIVT